MSEFEHYQADHPGEQKAFEAWSEEIRLFYTFCKIVGGVIIFCWLVGALIPGMNFRVCLGSADKCQLAKEVAK